MVSMDPVPAAALRLFELLTDAMAEEWSVDFGPIPGTTDSLKQLVVGLSTEDLAVVSGQVAFQGGMADDQFDINCMAQVVVGDTTAEALGRCLSECYAAMQQVAQVLRDAPDLDGAINWGRITRHQAQWVQTDGGMPGALVLFPVAAHTYRTAQ